MSSLLERSSFSEAVSQGMDEVTALYARIRRNKLLGLWAAELQGFDALRAEDFANGFIARGPSAHDDTDRLARLEQTLAALGVTREEICRKITDLEFQARFDVYAMK